MPVLSGLLLALASLLVPAAASAQDAAAQDAAAQDAAPQQAEEPAAAPAAGGLAVAGATAPRGEPLNKIVIRVNERVATLHDFQGRLQNAFFELQSRELPPERLERAREALPKNVFRSLFEETLLLSRADQLRVEVTQSEIDDAVRRLREANDIATDEELARILAQQGKSWEQYRQEMADTLRLQQVVGREVYSEIQLEEDDLRLFYRDNPELFQVPEQRLLKGIVVLDSSALSETERRQLADELADQLAAGGDPAELVAETAGRGETSGVLDLEWVPVGDLDSALEGAVSQLAVGDWSRPVEGRGGLHLLNLVDKQAERVRPFDEVRDAIYRRQQNIEISERMPRYLAEVEEASFVMLDVPSEAEGFRRAEQPAPPDPLDVYRQGAGNDDGADAEGR